MRKVEEKGYGDEIIDAGDIFCNYGIGRHLCKKACDKCRRLCIGRKIGRPLGLRHLRMERHISPQLYS